jgi:hypothetical protein
VVQRLVKGSRREAQLGHDPDVVHVDERCRQVGVIFIDDCWRGARVTMLVPGARGRG